MQNLLIYGAGGFGRETLDIVRTGYASHFERVAFLDDGKAGDEVRGVPVLSLANALREMPPAASCVAVAVGAPVLRRKMALLVQEQGYPLATLIDPTALVRETAVLEAGVIICAQVMVSCETHLGENTAVNAGAIIGHDVTVAEHCMIGPSTNVLGNVKLGEGVEIGTKAAIYPQTTVGAWARIAMGSCVYKDVEPNVTASGDPARSLARREPGWHLK